MEKTSAMTVAQLRQRLAQVPAQAAVTVQMDWEEAPVRPLGLLEEGVRVHGCFAVAEAQYVASAGALVLQMAASSV